MDKDKASLVTEATLWQLYRRLLAQELLLGRLSPSRNGSRSHGAEAAALGENLLAGDTLGLDPKDIAARYLCGMSLFSLRTAVDEPAPRKRKGAPRTGWALPTDAAYGLLPAEGALQAAYGVGCALASHIHRHGSLTVLLGAPEVRGEQAAVWADAMQAATTLHLPMLFVTRSHRGLPQPPPEPARAAVPMPTIPVDRNDAVALYRVFYESATRARHGGGPTCIDCRNTGLRGEQAAGTALARMEATLRARGAFDRSHARQMQLALEREFTRAGWR